MTREELYAIKARHGAAMKCMDRFQEYWGSFEYSGGLDDILAMIAEVERLWERESAAEQALAPLPAMLGELAGALENMLSLAAEAQGLAGGGGSAARKGAENIV